MSSTVLAEEQELTPFERSIEVWRQLWRVLERSHLIVQIVDTRNPVQFRRDSEGLDQSGMYIGGTERESGSGSADHRRKSILLINKADLLTYEQQ